MRAKEKLSAWSVSVGGPDVTVGLFYYRLLGHCGVAWRGNSQLLACASWTRLATPCDLGPQMPEVARLPAGFLTAG